MLKKRDRAKHGGAAVHALAASGGDTAGGAPACGPGYGRQHSGGGSRRALVLVTLYATLGLPHNLPVVL